MIPIPIIRNYPTVILANGAFPKNPDLLFILKQAKRVICCDGATESLVLSGREPDYIVGDLDSIPAFFKECYYAILHHDPDQETNDLTKAVHFCVENGWIDITILGATGKREDHTLANISLLGEYSELCNAQMLTDYGSFMVPLLEKSTFESFKKQQVSLFSLNPSTIISSKNLKYSLENRTLSSWWQGTLNEATNNSFEIEYDEGKLIIFREFK